MCRLCAVYVQYMSMAPILRVQIPRVFQELFPGPVMMSLCSRPSPAPTCVGGADLIDLQGGLVGRSLPHKSDSRVEALFSLFDFLSPDTGAFCAPVGALWGISHEDRSFPAVLCARGREGALGEETDTEASLSLQREALTGLAAGGAAGLEVLMALSLTKVRFAGKESIIKFDRAEEVMATA
jgi:hypothetical protein